LRISADASYQNELNSLRNSGSLEELTSKYREISKKYHPDRNPGIDTKYITVNLIYYFHQETGNLTNFLKDILLNIGCQKFSEPSNNKLVLRWFDGIEQLKKAADLLRRHGYLSSVAALGLFESFYYIETHKLKLAQKKLDEIKYLYIDALVENEDLFREHLYQTEKIEKLLNTQIN
jgi:hypothetical protein